MTRLALIADPHLHDCGWRPANSGLPGAIRSYAETIASTRIFNESAPAFRAALDLAVAEGARQLLLIGDLTDDGQAPNIAAAVALLEGYRQSHGLRVFATPGNHDFFALTGRPQRKTFLAADGRPVKIDSATTPEAATLGTLPALQRMGQLGYQPDPRDLHWETPFGTNPDWSARHYAVPSPDGRSHCQMIDASYLVEPIPGLWLLSLDANTCPPRNGTRDVNDPAQFHDPTDLGWSGVLAHRAHLMGWMRDVAQRARALGKQLISFSHYPTLDPLGGASAEEVALFGSKGLARRAPPAEVSEAFAATGVQLHLSGHLHVNDTAAYHSAAGSFLNIAIPSPVGFPPALKLAELGTGQISFRTLSLANTPLQETTMAAYRAEATYAGQPIPPACTAPDLGSFLDAHLGEIVRHRYIPREWPADMAAFIATAQASDLLALIGVRGLAAPDLAMSVLAEDFYRLRKGGSAAYRYLPPERLTFYRRLCADLPARHGDSLAARFTALMWMMGAYLSRLPNSDFTVQLPDLQITPL